MLYHYFVIGIENTWNPHSVELALWTHYVANEFKPELLNSVPEPIKKPMKSEQTNTDALINGIVIKTEVFIILLFQYSFIFVCLIYLYFIAVG